MPQFERFNINNQELLRYSPKRMVQQIVLTDPILGDRMILLPTAFRNFGRKRKSRRIPLRRVKVRVYRLGGAIQWVEINSKLWNRSCGRLKLMRSWWAARSGGDVGHVHGSPEFGLQGFDNCLATRHRTQQEMIQQTDEAIQWCWRRRTGDFTGCTHAGDDSFTKELCSFPLLHFEFLILVWWTPCLATRFIQDYVSPATPKVTANFDYSQLTALVVSRHVLSLKVRPRPLR